MFAPSVMIQELSLSSDMNDVVFLMFATGLITVFFKVKNLDLYSCLAVIYFL